MDDTRIVLLGKTGSGKSSLANTIFGKNVFSVGNSPNSETKTCSVVTRPVGERRICLIDTPGLFDTDPNSQSQAILQCMEFCDPGPHAFLLVLKVGIYSEQEQAVVDIILQYFSEEALKYTTVVFTHGEDIKKKKTITKWVSQNEKLSELVQKCGGRCHVFDNTHWNNNQNKHRNNKKQVKLLLNTIDRTVAQNRGTYTISNLETIRNNWVRFREAPVSVQLAAFLGVDKVLKLIESDLPWAEVKEIVTYAAQAIAKGKVWVWDPITTMNQVMREATDFLTNLGILFRSFTTVCDVVRSTTARFCIFL